MTSGTRYISSRIDSATGSPSVAVSDVISPLSVVKMVYSKNGQHVASRCERSRIHSSTPARGSKRNVSPALNGARPVTSCSYFPGLSASALTATK